MNPLGPTPRRGFLARLAGAAALAAGGSLPGGALAAQGSAHDRWLTGLKGAHRCLFDFPGHGAGLPLIHVYNYVNTYRTAYGAPPGSVNDLVWEKYKIGELLKLTDPVTRLPSTRNMFFRPRAGDPVFFGGAFAVAGIESLQRMGTTFLMCNNAFQSWMAFLSGSGTKGNPAGIEREIRANLLPGVVTVPAMVIAIEKAQAAGVAYNRQ